jgi:hypothetical protein
MNQEQCQQLNQDLASAVQVEVSGISGGYANAPRSGGYHAMVDPVAQVIKIGRDQMDKKDWIKPLADVDVITIWTNRKGGRVYWENSGSGEFERIT